MGMKKLNLSFVQIKQLTLLCVLSITISVSLMGFNIPLFKWAIMAIALAITTPFVIKISSHRQRSVLTLVLTGIGAGLTSGVGVFLAMVNH